MQFSSILNSTVIMTFLCLSFLCVCVTVDVVETEIFNYNFLWISIKLIFYKMIFLTNSTVLWNINKRNQIIKEHLSLLQNRKALFVIRNYLSSSKWNKNHFWGFVKIGW